MGMTARIAAFGLIALTACVPMQENVAPPGPLAAGQTVRVAIEGDGALVSVPLVACARPSGLCVDWPQFDSPEVQTVPGGYRFVVADEVAVYTLNTNGTGTLEAPEAVTPLVWFL